MPSCFFTCLSLILFLASCRPGSPSRDREPPAAAATITGQPPGAVRQGPWLLYAYDDSPPCLYHLTATAGRPLDLAAVHPDVVARLTALRAWQRELYAATPAREEPERQRRRHEHLAFGREVRMTPSPAARFGPAAVLTDGLPADTADLSTLAGLNGRPLQITIDLGELLLVERLRASFLHAPALDAFPPATLEFFISTDGKSFKSRGRIDRPPPADPPPRMAPFVLEMRPQPVRHVRLRAVPETAGKGWLLVEEVWVE